MSDFPVEVVRSPRRKRTAQARLVDGTLRVMVPAGLEPEVEGRLVSDVVTRVLRKHSSTEIDLEARASQLSSKYRLPSPTSIEWSDRQMSRWGSCSTGSGKIRISNRLASMPPWVLDSVIVHELAHLAEPDHGTKFQALVSRYELTERAKGYLMAKDEGTH